MESKMRCMYPMQKSQALNLCDDRVSEVAAYPKLLLVIKIAGTLNIFRGLFQDDHQPHAGFEERRDLSSSIVRK